MSEEENDSVKNANHSPNSSQSNTVNVIDVHTVVSDFDSDIGHNEPDEEDYAEKVIHTSRFSETGIKKDNKSEQFKWHHTLVDGASNKLISKNSRLDASLSQVSFKRSVHVAEYKSEVTYDDHLLPIDALLIRYNLNLETGMSTENAEKQLAIEGKNVLAQGVKKTICKLLVRNLFYGFSMLLWAGGFLALGSYVLDILVNNRHSSQYISLCSVLFSVNIFTGLFGFYQDYKATMVMDAFTKMIPMYAKVLRDGQIQTIACENLVVGDIVVINSGDIIPADIRLIETTEMRVDMSALTGESEPQMRTTECTHRFPIETKNLAFFSSYCTQGNGKGIVIAIGDHTMIGHIAILAKGLEKDETPIAIEIKHFIFIISIVATVMGLIFFGLALYNNSHIIDALIYMLGIMVANVPEGIVVTVTACLTLTTKMMAKKNCFIKEMEAIETLGCTTIICSDKTGTLTQNLMTVNMLFYDTLIKTVNMDIMKLCNDRSFAVLCLIATLCLTAEFRQKPVYDYDIIRNAKIEGDASESAILRFVEQLFGQTHETRKQYPKIFEIPFNSVNKFQISVHKQPNSTNLYLVIKGAPEIIVRHCTEYCLNGENVPFSDSLKLLVQNSCNKLAGFGQRILGFADLILPSQIYNEQYKFRPEPINFPINELRFCGLIGLIDPPKLGVREAVSTCQKAGIRIAMVTGDHPMTAMAIARDIGILSEDSLSKYDVSIENNISLSKIEDDERFTAAIITGDELRRMMPNDVRNVFIRYKEVVFARMSPQQKLLLVESAQSLGHIVAVTGDGVNDSPALKKANIGIAMGIAGNDVSKQAADIILLDDNFASIVTGIEEGRLIYENLKKSIAYTVTSNIPEMTPYLAYIIWGIPLPLTLLYILVIDLGTDLLPAISIAYEKSEFDIMHYPPRDRDSDKLVNDRLISYAYGLVGITQTFAGFFGYFLVMGSFGFYPFRLLHIRNEWECPGINDLEDSFGQMWTYEERMHLQRLSQTTYFVSLVITQVADAIICKTRRISVLKQGMGNWVLNFSILIELLLTCFLVYTPVANNILNTVPVAWFWWLPGIPFAILLILLDEIRKYCIRNYPHGWVAKNAHY